jgi:phosphoglycolate phosphatase-like HAD superfamily hydrolase
MSGGGVQPIEAVFFDVGETIVDETREYGTWADWLGIPRHTFSAVFGAVIARGVDYRETFQYFRPGFDLATERERRAEAAQPETFADEDLYSDARSCLSELQQMGLRVGLAGNQTARAGRILKSLDLPVDLIGTSDGWGIEKPSPAFFARMVEEAGCAAESVLYVKCCPVPRCSRSPSPDSLRVGSCPAWPVRGRVRRAGAAGHGRADPRAQPRRFAFRARSCSARTRVSRSRHHAACSGSISS